MEVNGWRSRVPQLVTTVTNTKTGGCSDYQLHRKKNKKIKIPTTRLSSYLRGVPPGKHAYTPAASNQITAASLSVQKQKQGANHDGRTEDELQQNAERRLGRISQVSVCSFSPLQVPSRETTPTSEHEDESRGSFFLTKC